VPSMVPLGSGQQQQQQVGGGLPPRGFGAAAALPVTSWLGMEGPGGGSSSAAGTPAVPQLPLQQLGSASPRLRPPSTTSSPRLASQAAAGAAAEMSRSVQCSSGGAGLSMGGGPAGAGGSDSAAGSRPISAVSGSSICSGDTGAMLAAKLQGLAVVENDEYSHDFDLVNREYVKAGHTLPVEPGERRSGVHLTRPLPAQHGMHDDCQDSLQCMSNMLQLLDGHVCSPPGPACVCFGSVLSSQATSPWMDFASTVGSAGGAGPCHEPMHQRPQDA
jgi:hypothetical protein